MALAFISVQVSRKKTTAVREKLHRVYTQSQSNNIANVVKKIIN